MTKVNQKVYSEILKPQTVNTPPKAGASVSAWDDYFEEEANRLNESDRQLGNPLLEAFKKWNPVRRVSYEAICNERQENTLKDSFRNPLKILGKPTVNSSDLFADNSFEKSQEQANYLINETRKLPDKKRH